ncbi:hypothetical protein [Reinekea blandensis]|uniref:hypothetical protein n=1 Tax=Reinekea blandensis TaxID=374838 RepID=UPI0012B5A8DE|nr:hypothetical protein [Reinekea blandensis]
MTVNLMMKTPISSNKGKCRRRVANIGHPSLRLINTKQQACPGPSRYVSSTHAIKKSPHEAG